MPEDTPQTPAEPVTITNLPASLEPPNSPIAFDIGEEFGTARKNLPPMKIVGIVVAVIAIVAAIVALMQKPRQKATGAIENVLRAEIPNQNMMMVAIKLSIHNHGKRRFLPREVKTELETDNGSFTDQAASAVDVPRYVQAFPALVGDGTAPLQFETAIAPGGQTKGMIIVTFPVSADVFANRKLIRVTLTGP